MSYILHEHSTYTSAIDKYWVFNNKKDALEAYKELLIPCLDILDVDIYEEEHDDNNELGDKFDIRKIQLELLMNEDDITIFLTEGNYLVFSELKPGSSSSLNGMRP